MSHHPADAQRTRLPTLFEVLNLRTQAPVDLWCFYVFMREEYRGIEYLDFWLAVVKHLSLCRNYVRGLRQSIIASERDMSSSRTSSVLLDNLIQEGTLDDTDSHRLSAFLRGEDAEGHPGSLYRLSALIDSLNTTDQALAAELEQLKNKQVQNYQNNLPSPSNEYSLPTPNSSNAGAAWAQEKRKNTGSPIRVVMPQSPDQQSNSLFNEKIEHPETSPNNKTPSNPIPKPGTTSNLYDKGVSAKATAPNRFSKVSRVSNVHNLPAEATTTSFVSRNDIKQSTHFILVTYFIPGAEREIVLPQRIMRSVRHAIEVEGRDDPEVFEEAREYVFEALQREAFRAFLAAKALGNTTPFGSVIRLIIGLVSMFAAFWVAFILIFLDWQPKSTRLWLILPFGVGIYGLCSGLYNLDPLMAIMGYSETSPGKLIRIREPYVRSLLVKRAIYVLVVIVVVTACFVVLFALVPGKRL
ncbi:hypothetical protein D0Z00_004009 [Geotrichum galactomycetum]|uniref:Uncharacterized protein n=1 Tax=Geotrichum galactomycetum TaxID=27317 RepID=A0ACB6UZN8_9ASCO|nr:hypothetical protein D0Z00_004009 [Geotrichum candidum]